MTAPVKLPRPNPVDPLALRIIRQEIEDATGRSAARRLKGN